MQTSDLRERLTFQARIFSSDGYGNQEGEFADVFTVAAAVVPKLGGESILAGRLAGRNIVNITVRYDSDTALIDEEWRAIDARDATKIYNIRSVIDPDGKNQWIEMLAEEGVAT